MYAPYPENMMESIKKVEASRAERMKTEPRRLTADEKDALLAKFHPDYNSDSFAEIKVGPNKGQKAPLELAEMLHSTSRLMTDKVDISKIDYDVAVLVNRLQTVKVFCKMRNQHQFDAARIGDCFNVTVAELFVDFKIIGSTIQEAFDHSATEIRLFLFALALYI